VEVLESRWVPSGFSFNGFSGAPSPGTTILFKLTDSEVALDSSAPALNGNPAHDGPIVKAHAVSGGALAVGDQLYGIFNITTINSRNGFQQFWAESATQAITGEFWGYTVQSITNAGTASEVVDWSGGNIDMFFSGSPTYDTTTGPFTPGWSDIATNNGVDTPSQSAFVDSFAVGGVVPEPATSTTLQSTFTSFNGAHFTGVGDGFLTVTYSSSIPFAGDAFDSSTAGPTFPYPGNQDLAFKSNFDNQPEGFTSPSQYQSTTGWTVLSEDPLEGVVGSPRINLVKLTNGTNNDSPPTAGTPDGPLVPFGGPVTWTYNVTNPGDEPIANVNVTDSVAGVTPTPVLSGGFNVGDTNHNGLLDRGETWVFQATGTAQLGQYNNVGTVTGTSTITNTPLTANNPDHYFGVDANIQITPLTPVNEVTHNGIDHSETFTITVTALPGTSQLNAADVSFSTPTISYPGNTPDLSAPTSATFVSRTGNVATYTVTINSDKAGTFEVKAGDNITFSSPNSPNTAQNPNPLTLTRTTGDGFSDSNGSDSRDAVKNYVDALISITPLTSTNPLGTPHTFTITVNAYPAATGTPSFATPTISWGTSSSSTGGPTPPSVSGPTEQAGGPVNNGNGSWTDTWTVTINDSTTPNTFWLWSTDVVTMGGVPVTRSTGDGVTTGDGKDGGPGEKIYVAGNISGSKLLATPTPGETCRMTGGGSVFTAAGDIAINNDGSSLPVGTRITHGFELDDPLSGSNNLEINWGGGQDFHLTTLTQAIYIQEPGFSAAPPAANCNTLVATGTGTLNQVAGYTIWFTFTDHGEPGSSDTAAYLIKDPSGNVVLSVGAQTASLTADLTGPTLTFGNQQMHNEHAASFNGGITTQPWTIGGVTILLLNSTQTQLIAFTPLKADGTFQFNGLAPGNYVVAEEFPAGYTEESPTSGTAITWTTLEGLSTDQIGPLGFTVTVTANTTTPILAPFINELTPVASCRWTGGGSVFTGANDFALSTTGTNLGAGTRITHGFRLECDLATPNRLEINWGGGQNFHLTTLTNATCFNDPSFSAGHPDSTCNTIIAAGVGSFNNVNGYNIEFTFTDHGEPGSSDTAKYLIWLDQPGTTTNPGTPGIYDPGIDTLILSVNTTTLDMGNQQAHKDESGGSGAAVAAGQFASTSFWNSSKGQSVIQSFNGGSNATALANWLAANYPNLFGNAAGPMGNVAGLTNGQVAQLYKNLATSNGNWATSANTYLQAAGVALGIYADTTSLGGADIVANGLAAKYGILVTTAGGAGSTVSDGADAPAFGTLSGTPISTGRALKVANNYYDPKAQTFFGGDSVGIGMANDLLNAINNAGGVGQGSPQLAAGSTSPAGAGLTELLGGAGTLLAGPISVAVDLPAGQQAPAEQAAIANALSALNAEVGPLGFRLAQVSGTDADAAQVRVGFAATTDIGGEGQGVMAAFTPGNRITLVDGWNWYFGLDGKAIAPTQYDFQTVLIHELGHVLGLGENSDPSSAMSLYLSPGQVRRGLTADDLDAIRQELAAGSSVAAEGALPQAPAATPVQDAGPSFGAEPGSAGAARPLARGPQSESPSVPDPADSLLSELSGAQEAAARGASSGAFTVTAGQGRDNLPANTFPTAFSTALMTLWPGAASLWGSRGGDTLPGDDEVDPEVRDGGGDQLLSRPRGDGRTGLVVAPTAIGVVPDAAWIQLRDTDTVASRSEGQLFLGAMAGDNCSEEALGGGGRRDGVLPDHDWDDRAGGNALAPALVTLAFLGWSGPSRHESRGLLSRRARRPNVSA
jgi:uncharacterized repeat protein (TIGR01451 family)